MRADDVPFVSEGEQPTDTNAVPTADDHTDECSIDAFMRAAQELPDRIEAWLENPENHVAHPVTRNDLLVLGEQWAKAIRDGEVMLFMHGQSSGTRRSLNAGIKLKLLAKTLGTEAIHEVWATVDAETRRELGPTLWQTFRHGTCEERGQVAEALHVKDAYLNAKVADEDIKAKALAYLRANPTGVYRDGAGDLWSLTDRLCGGDPDDARLGLMVTTLCHGSSGAGHRVIERPAGWFAPYSLGC